MRSHVGVRRLRSGLSGYLARAAAGETIIVTVDGQPRARLAPLSGDGESSLELLAQRGGVQRPGGDRPPVLPGADKPVPATGVDIVRLLKGIRG